MTEYTVLFVGGYAPEEEREADMKKWMEWIGSLGDTYKGGSAHGENPMMFKDGEAAPLHEAAAAISGHMVVSAESMDAAMEIAKQAPNVAYGGSVYVFENLDMNM